LKAKLATEIAQLIEQKGWTQTQTAERTAKTLPLPGSTFSSFAHDLRAFVALTVCFIGHVLGVLSAFYNLLQV